MSKRPTPKKSRTPDKPEVEISYAFGFDAAHRFTTSPRGHKYRGVHGHSFQCQVVLRGTPRAPHGFVTDLGKVERICLALRKQLDHTLLNEIKYLESTSLEHLSVWIWRRLSTKLPGLARVTLRRDSLGQACSYSGVSATANP